MRATPAASPACPSRPTRPACARTWRPSATRRSSPRVPPSRATSTRSKPASCGPSSRPAESQLGREVPQGGVDQLADGDGDGARRAGRIKAVLAHRKAVSRPVHQDPKDSDIVDLGRGAGPPQTGATGPQPVTQPRPHRFAPDPRADIEIRAGPVSPIDDPVTRG